MQDEELDKIVREAAKQHHPPYDDNAWDKMAQLLDEHLPQKKDKRKPVWILLLALLTLGTLFYTLIYPGMNRSADENKQLAQQQTNDNVKHGQTNTINSNNEAKVGQNIISESNVTSPGDNVQDVVSNKSNTGGDDISANRTGVRTNGAVVRINPTVIGSDPKENIDPANSIKTGSSIKVSNKGRTRISIKNPQLQEDANVANLNATQKVNKNKVTDIKEETTEEEATNEVSMKPPVSTEKENTVAKIADLNKNKTPTQVITDKVKTSEQPKEDKKTTSKKDDKKQQGFAGNFGITASAGTDLSYVDAGHLGKATFIYGAGLSYTIKKRLTIRTGFYVSKKIYSATPSQYNGVAYPYLDKIDGDCKVYEIPVTASYNFGAKGKHNWFGSAGLSSFIMKKEYYNYTYKAWGSTYSYDKTLNNENKHAFSVLNLSAGYQYNLSPRVSLMAEPFVKLPLTGIGDGKIKLNSAGILMTATVKPFSKKKKG